MPGLSVMLARRLDARCSRVDAHKKAPRMAGLLLFGGAAGSILVLILFRVWIRAGLPVLYAVRPNLVAIDVKQAELVVGEVDGLVFDPLGQLLEDPRNLGRRPSVVEVESR